MKISKVIFHIKPIPSHPWWECKNVQDYDNILAEILSQNKDVLCCVFDFGKNLPLPKIPGNAQFYLRLIWFNVFNVHILNNSESYMFTFMEGFLDKGGNTICNFLLYAIREDLKKNITLIMCIGTYSILWHRRIYEFLCVHTNPIWKGRNCRDYRPSHLTFRKYFRPIWFSRSCVVVAYCNRRIRSSNVQGFVSTVPTVYEEEEK